ncbi:MAG: histidine kinase [Ignavibacteria bacterium]|nr:histidine kinase [Ignavibacteria bacterium]
MVSYFISVAAALLVFEIIRFILNSPVNSEIFGTQNIVLTFFIAVIVSWLYVISRDWIINIGELERLRSEKLSTELAFLKTQVDPHFLFNTLNSIYALSLEEDSPKTADSIIKLFTDEI